MDEYNIMIGCAVIVAVIVIAVVVHKMMKKDRYTYTGGTPASTTNTAGSTTTWPTVVLANTPVPTPSATLTASSLIADASGNLSVTAAVPIGAILMWCGTSAPAGWALCDGTSGGYSGITPDLRGRFIVGINGQSSENLTALQPGDIGGEEFHQLSVAEMPSHTHTTPTGAHNASYSGGDNWIYNAGSVTGGAGGDPANSNATLPHNNMPPFYALAYIMKMM
jgi:microcystin-dependent protein